MSGILPTGFLIKERIAKFFQRRITSIDSAQQSNKDEVFPTFLGHFHPKKSDI